ncbi:hypothetical protein GCM10017714_19460 [Curtobacterium pusillum]|nr:hypothetical protein GCM10017610_25980 [Curtobacterium pusillum]
MPCGVLIRLPHIEDRPVHEDVEVIDRHLRDRHDQAFPNRREKNPPEDGSFWCPWHRCDFGTPRITWSTCWPQPAHDAFPHFLHVTARHMVDSFCSGPAGHTDEARDQQAAASGLGTNPGGVDERPA